MNLLGKLTYWLLIMGSLVRAQNLIPNPSFEDTINCPTTIGQLNKSKFWFNPTQSTPDYFNFCSTANGNAVHVPNNAFGSQSAIGLAYGGFYGFNKGAPNVREYVSSSLTSPLTANHRYLVSFFVSLSDWSQYSINSVGAYFSSTPISSTNSVVLTYTPQIQNKSSNQLTDKTTWMEISDTLLASGGEQYVTIGNFYSSAQSDTTYLGNIGGNDISYYYIDSVSVIDIINLGVSEAASIGVKVSPNPANSILNIEARLQDAEIGVYDMLGNKLRSERLNYKNQLDISQFSEGVYFLRIWNKEKTYSTKFVKE